MTERFVQYNDPYLPYAARWLRRQRVRTHALSVAARQQHRTRALHLAPVPACRIQAPRVHASDTCAAPHRQHPIHSTLRSDVAVQSYVVPRLALPAGLVFAPLAGDPVFADAMCGSWQVQLVFAITMLGRSSINFTAASDMEKSEWRAPVAAMMSHPASDIDGMVAVRSAWFYSHACIERSTADHVLALAVRCSR